MNHINSFFLSERHLLQAIPNIREKWLEDHRQCYQAVGLTWPGGAAASPASRAYLGSSGPELLAELSQREKDLLAFLVTTDQTDDNSGDAGVSGGPCSTSIPNKPRQDERAADLLHSIGRLKGFKEGCSPCLLPRSDIWLHRARRLLGPHEAFLLQCWDLQHWGVEIFPEGPGLVECAVATAPLQPPSRGRKRGQETTHPAVAASHLPASFSRRFLMDLAGNAFCGACVGLSLLVCMAHTTCPVHAVPSARMHWQDQDQV